MQAEKLHDTSKSKFSGNLFKNYQWFSLKFCDPIITAAKEYLNPDLGLNFVGISEKDNLFFAGEDYFVTKIRVTKELNVLFRISKSAIQIILEDVLGTNGKSFVLEDLTELEAKLFTSFNDYLFKSFSSSLLKVDPNNKKTKNTNECHMTFFIKGSLGKVGKVIVSIPIELIPNIPERKVEYTFELESFPNVLVPVDIQVGTTRIPLVDLKNIEVEDIVVLEQSNINKMVLYIDDTKMPFRLNPDPSLIISFDDDNGGKIMDETITQGQNMWDSIQVDISAEFEQVKIPLGDLRQISEGLVVDIGSVYENKIDLKVEDKIIASGELVIINDRYGVRVDHLYKDDPKAQAPVGVEDEVIDEAEGSKDEDFNEEDFDYSNFEIEDENI